MLILSRRENESITIGDNITVTVTKIARDNVEMVITENGNRHVVNRGVNEVVPLTDDIHIQVTKIVFNQVKIGIDAPKKVPVHREEFRDRLIKSGEGNISLGGRHGR
jgi:carbon storage regulator